MTRDTVISVAGRQPIEAHVFLSLARQLQGKRGHALGCPLQPLFYRDSAHPVHGRN